MKKDSIFLPLLHSPVSISVFLFADKHHHSLLIENCSFSGTGETGLMAAWFYLCKHFPKMLERKFNISHVWTFPPMLKHSNGMSGMYRENYTITLEPVSFVSFVSFSLDSHWLVNYIVTTEDKKFLSKIHFSVSWMPLFFITQNTYSQAPAIRLVLYIFVWLLAHCNST